MSISRIDLHSHRNESCVTGCNKELRKKVSENDLCSLTNSVVDSLSVRCVGEWAEQKIYLLYQYFGIFAQGMKNKWAEINYIEICSGPGRCVNRNGGIEIDGTALCIMNHAAFKFIHKALFFDYSPQVVAVLNKRIESLGLTNATAIKADYNQADSLCSVLAHECSKDRSLNLILLDPTDCSVPFNLIQQIKTTLKNVDFIINVATGTDFNRNIPMAFNDTRRAAKYQRFLGDSSFFSKIENINLYKQKNYNQLRNNFREAYQESMKKIGYEYFRVTRIEHYYDILFAAGHTKAIEFWDSAQAIKFDGQRSLF